MGDQDPLQTAIKFWLFYFRICQGELKSRTNFRRWISPLSAPKLYITKTLERSVLDLKFKLDSMLTQGTAVLREGTVFKEDGSFLHHRQYNWQHFAVSQNMCMKYSKGCWPSRGTCYTCAVCLSSLVTCSLPWLQLWHLLPWQAIVASPHWQAM